MTTPTSLQNLAALNRSQLRDLHAKGTTPDIHVFDGPIQGMILGSGMLGRLNIWRGKAFQQGGDGHVSGFNRIGFGPIEILRYAFEMRLQTSHFAQRDVALLDHDRPENPTWVRRYHDELVEVNPGLFLATSHQWAGDKLKFRAYFALALPAT